MEDSRFEERIPKVVLIRYYETSEPNGKPLGLFHFALTSNVSRSGVAFRSLKPIVANRTLRLVNEALWGFPREGVVKWCTKTSPGVYKVGVALT